VGAWGRTFFKKFSPNKGLRKAFSQTFLLQKEKENKIKTSERLRRSELCNTLRAVLTFYMLEKFLKWGLGRDFFQKVPPQQRN
jgi:hypothetical protein